MRALDPTDYHDHLWRPDRRARPKDFVADFKICGRKSLVDMNLDSRLVFFELYYVDSVDYNFARAIVGLNEMAGVRWTEQIRSVVGAACLERQLFPPKQYFGG